MKRWLVIVCFSMVLVGTAAADEGMWLFNHPPTRQVKAKYGFQLTPEWLKHIQLSSVRFNNGGSGSFVSPDGLTFTNHHVAQNCLYGLSTEGKDLYKTGFYAKTRSEEAKCPDLELNVLQGMEDVTDKVNAGITAEMDAAETGTKQRANMSTVEAECAKSTGLRCDVVTLYSGSMYHLYKYKKYTDVRLVFAPEFNAAFFGGDPDNFEFPRYDMDVAFFRVYENDKPARLDHWLKWSTAGVKEGDLVFVSGHPGSTGRLNTIAQLEFLRDTSYPLALASYKRIISALEKFSAESPENARIAQENLFGYQNSQKAVTGYLSGLVDKALMEKKAAEEASLKKAFVSNPKNKDVSDPWSEIAEAEKVQKRIYLPLLFLERLAGFRGDMPRLARTLVRVVAEKQKPNPDRLREYRESNLPSLEQSLLSSQPVYKSLDVLMMTTGLEQMQEVLSDSPALKRALDGKTPAEAAQALVSGSQLNDAAVRKQLYEGGESAIQASTDPLIALMRDIDAEARALRKEWEDKVESVERREGARIAKFRFEREGANVPPDATFTLRLSYGAVRGFIEDGRGIVPKGTHVPYFTTLGGAFEHAAKHGNKPPYDLPESWMKAKSKVNLATPFNTTSTPDIIGGNSGSPVLNTKGEVVGIIFDGNIQSLPWRFVYEDKIGRSVEVDSRGIVEALRSIYGATKLTSELLGTQTSKKNGKKAEQKTAAPVK